MATPILLINIREIGINERTLFYKEAEMRSLLENLDYFVSSSLTFTVKNENPSFLIGKGQALEVKEEAILRGAEIIVFDTFLKPRYETNLEKLILLPVIDRESVILSIFYNNAHTLEAKLQIEKAEAIYLRPRLIGKVVSLSQQRGGIRGSKGEGEKLLELDRRRLEEKILKLDKELEKVKKVRDTKVKNRKRNNIFSFSLVGYTNAGKSTILNRLTGSSVLAEDRLFATLDTTNRSLVLPNREKVILTDTVGFISNLPHSLIKAFSSTLNEALISDALLVVLDASHPDVVGSFLTTKNTLEELGAWDKVQLLIINKVDSLLDDISLNFLTSQNIDYVLTSFKDEVGVDELLYKLAKIVDQKYVNITLLFSLDNPLLNEMYQNNEVLSVEYRDSSILVEARVLKTKQDKYKNYLF